ncbi:MAG: ABC transporter substrate-binding protein [Proteobacteria bacterium]|nr:ABC transporter substrate-binding protein [Pseudomonadota bacterium]
MVASSRRLMLVVLVGMAMLLLGGCAVPAAPPAEAPAETEEVETIKIGFMAASTGGAAFLGEPERDAALMIQDQLGGSVKGTDGTTDNVEFVIYDTEGSGDTAIPLAKKLIDDDKVAVIVGATRSPVSLALVPMIQEAEVPYISMASSSAIVEPVAERFWVFKSPQSSRHTAPWQIRYAKDKGLDKVANLYVNNAYGEDGRNAIREAAEAQGIEIVLEETFEASDTDITSQLTKVKASDAQALLVTGLPPAASILTKQFRELGLDMPLLHNHGIGMKPFIDLAGPENANGVLFPMGKLVAIDSLDDSDPQKAVLEQFVSDYESYSGNPSSTFAGHSWDALQIALKAVESLPPGLSLEEQRSYIRDTIENMEFVGTAGTFKFSPEDHVGLSPDDVVMVRIVDGEWEYFPPEEW